MVSASVGPGLWYVKVPGQPTLIVNEFRALASRRVEDVHWLFEMSRGVCDDADFLLDPPLDKAHVLPIHKFELNGIGLYFAIRATGPRQVFLLGLFDYATIDSNAALTNAILRLQFVPI